MFVVLGSVALACAPELDGKSEGAAPLGGGAELVLRLDPPAPAEAAPSALRLIVEGLDEGAEVHLFQGEVRDGHLAQLARGEMSMTLAERELTASTWREGDAVVVAPLALLEPNETYAVATGDPPWAGHVTIAGDDSVPILRLVYPPEGRSLAAPFGIWCGEEALPPVSVTLPLAPDGRPGTITRGAHGEVGAHCVRLTAEPGAGPVVPPPALAAPDGTTQVRFEPVALEANAAPPLPSAITCGALEHALSSGCLEVLDDRAQLTPVATPLLWAASGPPGLDAVLTTTGHRTWIWPLPAGSPITLRLTRIDLSGTAETSELLVTTLPPAPHLVLTEVYADAVGPEPRQEWVEIHNDGLAPASLAGWVLADNGGETELPAVDVAPGATVLVVRDDFDPTYPWDPFVAPDVVLVRVPQIGKGGLTNSGEPLELRAPEGTVVSRFPPTPKPKSGHSVLRLHPKISDDDPEGFIRTDTPTPGAVP